jgi:outer membrane lipoprotein SlyB
MVTVWALSVAAVPPEAEAAVDCEIGCIVVFGLSSFTVATGTATGWGRITGGISTQSMGQAIWATSFGLSLGAGFIQWGSPSHERMIFAAGIGSAAGALLGVALESAVGGGEGSEKIASALIGAAVGAVAGGVYGALSHEKSSGPASLLASRPPPVIGIRIPF